MKRYLKSSMRTAPSVPLGEVEDLVALGRPFAGDQVRLVIAVEMHLVGAIAELLALLELLDDVRIAGGRHERREPVEAGHDPVLDLAGRNLAGPADDARHAEAAFQHRPLAAGERRLAAVGPGEVLGAVVGREDDDGVVLEAVVLQLLHDRADDVVELRHAGFLDATSRSRACASSRTCPKDASRRACASG